MRVISRNIHARIAILRRDKHACKHCGLSVKNGNFEIDHIIPLALGGKDTFWNLQLLCRTCNRKKGKRFVG
jgi:5-methylcytosine-specific restriction endonuclease McrA